MRQQWLDWAQRIQAIAQSGQFFSKDAFDIERYKELQEISAEIISNHSNVKKETVLDLLSAEVGYQTPKIDVRGVVFHEGKILMVKEKMDNKWSLPGGFCDVGLSASENVVKEIKEEAGYHTNVKKLLAVLDMNKHPHPPEPFHYYKLFIQCVIIGGTAKTGLETKGIQFFSKDQLPPLSTRRNTESQLKMVFEYLRDPDKASVID